MPHKGLPTEEAIELAIQTLITQRGFRYEAAYKTLINSDSTITYNIATGALIKNPWTTKEKFMVGSVLIGLLACFSGFYGAFSSGGPFFPPLAYGIGSAAATFVLNIDGSFNFDIDAFNLREIFVPSVADTPEIQKSRKIFIVASLAAIPPAVLAAFGMEEFQTLFPRVDGLVYVLDGASGIANAGASTFLNYHSIKNNLLTSLNNYREKLRLASTSEKAWLYSSGAVVTLGAIWATAARACPTYNLMTTIPIYLDILKPYDFLTGLWIGIRWIIVVLVPLITSIPGLMMFWGSSLGFIINFTDKYCPAISGAIKALFTCHCGQYLKGSTCCCCGHVNESLKDVSLLKTATFLLILCCAYFGFFNYMGLSMKASAVFLAPWLPDIYNLYKVLEYLGGSQAGINLFSRFESLNKNIADGIIWMYRSGGHIKDMRALDSLRSYLPKINPGSDHFAATMDAISQTIVSAAKKFMPNGGRADLPDGELLV
jgi:hypothetical protein